MQKDSPDFHLANKISDDIRKIRIATENNLLPTVYYALPQGLTRAILNEKPYAIHAAYIQGCNPLSTWSNAKETYEALLKLDFLTVTDMFMTPTAALADIILPVTTYLEFDSIVTPPYYLPVSLVQQQVTRIPDCRSDYEILFSLASQLGLGEYFWKTEQECLDYILSPVGISFREFKDVGILQGIKYYRSYQSKGFSTPSGKI